MTDHSFVLVDSNIIFDISGSDPNWSEWSNHQLSQLVGRLLVNPIIYAELCYDAEGSADIDVLLLTLGIRYESLPKEALFSASQAYKTYRSRGGIKTAPLSDFFIGAHAAALGIPILTRDVARYRTYFPQVELICP